VVRVGGGLLLAVVLSIAVLLLVRPASAGTDAHPVPVRYHVVMPGETLLGIAAREQPGVDARDTAARIIELNAMSGSGLVAGQRIALPAAS
jgi:predicted Zn-dependent protease